MKAAVLALILTLSPGAALAQGHADVVAAMEAGSWDRAYALAAQGVQTDLVTWERLRAGDGDFAEYAAFLSDHADWPGLDAIRSEGERAIPGWADPAQVIAFFGNEDPLTGEGVAALAEALMDAGRFAEAESVLIQAWMSLGLDDDGFDALIGPYGAVLAPFHVARVDAMLWRWRVTDAGRLLDRLPEDQSLLAEARIALIRDAADVETRLAAVPEALREEPGLAYDRFNRFASRGDYTNAIAILGTRTASADGLGDPFRWASWRAALARWTMRDGRPQEAYDLASSHHLTSGSQWADLEWLSGYIALRHLNSPGIALQHFRALEADVESPISIARAGYWTGRALEALGQPDDAALAFARAAQQQTAFYGLLAAERLGLSLDPALTGQEAFPDWREAAFLADPRAQALRLSLQGGDRGAAVQFTVALAQDLDRTGLAQLGAMVAEEGEPFFALIVGKQGAARGITLPEFYFPLHGLKDMELPVEPALALSIARRESEFNPVIGSPVGALGLMQLMPGTAEEVSRGLGLAYSRGRLTSDWEYNATLGSRYLAGLEEEFGESPVMIAAGYNAGPSRPSQWMAQRGDPRRGQADIVDWIESIPFTETRNYVMRVTESIPVYRARLSGQAGPVRFTELLEGRPPFIRPVPRPASPVAAVAGVPTAAARSADPLPGAPRPEPRPPR
ncbi:lytic transglycosylase domain-containing protein [Pseudoroseicyclus aestuarii]|uniref:Soluble lytic murein transglycosylase n=1 Tax=Pseudoroseicyclus aestuarii TaxID=1795041 RepID=A0A318SYI6_9RHOB|nr:lytic transglycosylase domain-containing protein [Pseudoroseicyclus aestuarii]PYE84897.1 soluble lytic murein transglycosylase [Pseudoroseicyclus aestuarii]